MLRNAFAAALFVALLPYQALAQEMAGGGAYVETRIGLFKPDDNDANVFGTAAELTFDPGWAVEVATGYYISDYFRGELALAWRQTEVDDLEILSVDQPLDESYIGLFTAMLNGYLELPLVLRGWGVRPFIGGGAGFAYFDVDIETTTGSLAADSGNFTFAFQALAGLAVQLTPSISITGTYSYLGTTDTEDGGLNGLTIKDYRTHTLMAGLRYSF
jgi:opacity protein-like surface antigen